jgi:transketolase C-terminal domain/subunit
LGSSYCRGIRSKGISAEVINIHTIKPDEEAILKSLAKTKCIVTAEEHNILGGLGEKAYQVYINNQLHKNLLLLMMLGRIRNTCSINGQIQIE